MKTQYKGIELGEFSRFDIHIIRDRWSGGRIEIQFDGEYEPESPAVLNEAMQGYILAHGEPIGRIVQFTPEVSMGSINGPAMTGARLGTMTVRVSARLTSIPVNYIGIDEFVDKPKADPPRVSNARDELDIDEALSFE